MKKTAARARRRSATGISGLDDILGGGLVIKKGNHERTIREVDFDDGKIIVGRPLTKFRGIFTGTPAPESTLPSKGRGHESV